MPQARPRDLGKSLALHSCAFALIALFVGQQERLIQRQEHDLVQELQELEEREREHALQQQGEMRREMMEQQVRQPLEDLVREELEPETAEAVIEDLREAVEQLVDQADAEAPISERSRDDQQALEEALRDQAEEALAEALTAAKERELLEQVEAYVRDRLAPELKATMERELTHKTGEQIKKQLEQVAKKNRKNGELKALEEAHGKELASKALADQALEAAREEAKAAAEREMQETTIPKAAERLTKAIDDQLAAQGMDRDAVEERLEDAINDALADELAADAVDGETALTKAEERMGLSDGSKAAAAAQRAQAAAEALRDAATAQQATAQDTAEAKNTSQLDSAAAAQQDVATQARAASAAAKDALAAAASASASATKAAESAGKAVRRGKAAAKAQAAAEQLGNGRKEEGEASQAAAAEALATAAESVQGVAEQLATAAAAAAAERPDAAALDSAASDAASTALGAKLAAAVSEMVSTGAEAAASKAAKDANVGSLAKQLADSGALEDLGSTLAKLDPSNAEASARRNAAVASLAGGVMDELSASSESATADAGDATEVDAASEGATGEAIAAQASESGTATAASAEGVTVDGAGAGETAGAVPGSGAGGVAGNSAGVGVDAAGNGNGGIGGSAGQAADGGVEAPVQRNGAGVGGGNMSLGFDHDYQHNRHLGFNTELYHAFVKDLAQRLNPDNLYGSDARAAGDEAAGALPTSRAVAASDQVPGLIYVEGLRDGARKERVEREGQTESRELQDPPFTTKAYAAADFQAGGLTIDGDLSDWGELRHPLVMRYGPDDAQPVADTSGMPMAWMRWDQEHLYFAYRVDKAPDAIEPSVDKVYEGDCLELFLDMLNERKGDMTSSTYSHQFTFTPWGVKMREAGVTAWEVGRNFRGLQKHTTYSVPGAASRARTYDDHYTVEIKLPVRALARQRLVPGMYLAMDMSINRGFDYAKQTQWAASKVIKSWDKPDTWGDVVLLGSDAEARFIGYDDAADDARVVLPGRPLAFEVTDEDMDVTAGRDKVTAVVQVDGQAQKLLVILEATAGRSGVFRGSIDTQTYIADSKPGILNLRGGDELRLVYIDPRAAYGEADRRVEDRCTVGWPVMRMVQR